MPFFGISAIIQLVCIIHAIRTGRNSYWIMIILFLPLLGAAAYVVMEVAPAYQGNRHVRTARAKVASALDPEREVRAARDALEIAETVANRIRLADALAILGRYGEALPLYQDALRKTPGGDRTISARLARALFEEGAFVEALALIDTIEPPRAQGELDRLALLRARVLAELGRKEEALALYADIVTRVAGEEARCRYAALLIDTGHKARALSVLEEVEVRMKRLDRQQRAVEADMYAWATETLRKMRADRG